MLHLESFGIAESTMVLSSSAIQSLGWALLHFVWQGLLLAAFTGLAMFFLRKSSAHKKYLVQCLALALMASCPILTLCVIAIQQAGHSDSRVDSTALNGASWNSALTTYSIYQTPATSPAVELDVASATSSMVLAAAAETTLGSVSETAASKSGSLSTRQAWTTSLVKTLSSRMSWFVGGWLFGVFVLLLRVIGGWRIVNRLRTSSVIPASRVWQRKLEELATGMRISRSVQLMESTLIDVPSVIGWLRPVILFPVGILTSLTPLQLEAVLAHELAHVRRHDYLVNLVQTAVEILLFYHPAVWWLSRSIRIEREHCCDDAAVCVCNDRMTYVLALTEMEELRTTSGLMLAASGGSLVSRVRRIVNARSNERGHRSSDRWPAALVTLACLSAVLLFSIKSTYSALNKSEQDRTISETAGNNQNAVIGVLEVRGKVELPDGSPAEGAEVLALRVRPSASLEARVETTTDPDGNFSLMLTGTANHKAEWKVLSVHGANGGRLDDLIKIEPAAEAQNALSTEIVASKPIRLLPGSTISGRVLSKSTQTPVANARIYSGRGQILKTDDEGRFELRGVPTDIEELLVESPGMVATRVDIDVTQRTAATIDIFLTVAGELRGQALLPNGRPLPNATIYGGSSNIFFKQVFTRMTDNNGRFSFDVFPPNILQFPLSINSPTFQESTFEMFAIRDADQATEIIIPVEKILAPEPGGGSAGLLNSLAAPPNKPSLGLIRGRVVDNDGNPVRNFVVSLIQATPNGVNDEGGYSFYNRHFSEDDGRFVIGRFHADKRYCLAVAALDDSLAIVEPIFARTIEQITDADEAVFRLQPPSSLRIRVFDEGTNEPLPDVMVGLANSRTNRISSPEVFSWDFRLFRSKAEWTSEAGIADFSIAPGDKSILFVEHKGFARQYQFLNGLDATADHNASRVIELPLKKEARVRIQISSPVDRPDAEFCARIESDHSGSTGSSSKRNGEFQIVEMTCISPGNNKLTITESNGKQPWAAVLEKDIVLQTGDNELTIKLPTTEE